MPVNRAFHLSNFGDCCIFVTLSIDAELQYKFRRLRAYLYSQALRSSIPRPPSRAMTKSRACAKGNAACEKRP